MDANSGGAVVPVRPKDKEEKVEVEGEEENLEDHSVTDLAGGSSLRARCSKAIACLKSFIVPGYGMFSEAFFLFSVGNLKKGIFQESYPTCWNLNNTLNTDCTEVLRHSVSYTMIAAVILGMAFISIFGDKFGRRAGSILTSSSMLIGAILMTCSYYPTLQGQFVMFTIALAIFGVGVGGEYPLASSSATERASDPATRGKTVVLTFSMQGWGNWVYTALLLALLYNAGVDWSTTRAEYDPVSLNRIWRFTYGFGVAGLLVLSIGRVVFLEESEHFQKQMQKKKNASNKEHGPCIGITHFWHRLFGTAVSWFVWDITFYGNKLFQGTFIRDMVGDDVTPFQTLSYVLVNSTVALVGYYVAAYTIDRKWMGRRGMQSMGFLMTFLLFIICGFLYEPLTQRPIVFQIIYYASSFFGQWGPNATTWMLPSEIFPTEVRATAHGWSAACGKLGALVAGVLFGLTYFKENPEATFLVSGACGLVGLAVTIIFVPEAGRVSLLELDTYWERLKESQAYDGPVVRKENRSLCERWLNLTSSIEESDLDIAESDIESDVVTTAAKM